MGVKSKIEWTDDSWNPMAGCSLASPGCTHCYAMRMAARLSAMGQKKYLGTTKKVNGKAVWTGKINFDEAALNVPLKKKEPTRYFVNSMSDLFHEDVPDAFIDKVFAVMALCPQHTFQVLTKRAERMSIYCGHEDRRHVIGRAMSWQNGAVIPAHFSADYWKLQWPLPNVWLGVSVENQKFYDEREQYLAALHLDGWTTFYSIEPLLGPVKLRHMSVSWVIVGGESGPAARPMHPDWARSLREQCQAGDIPFFFKQWGEFGPSPVNAAPYPVTTIDGEDVCGFGRVGKKKAGRTIDGREWNEFPKEKVSV